ncbi:integrating conjugative element protein, partial [Xenorhabdus sp. Reich]|nr:integrating conjugative element protein [Xenorhabdus sp. Reich]
MIRKPGLLMVGGLALATAQVHASGLSVSLPAVTHSALGYGAQSSGAVSDTLFYTLGGGPVISEPASRAGSATLAGLELGWSSD